MTKFTVKVDKHKVRQARSPNRETLIPPTHQGKGLYATECIYAGEIIFQERPLVCAQFLWNAEYRYDACEFCLAPLESAQENVQRLVGRDVQLPYADECCPTDKSKHVRCNCGTRYCSDQCRQDSWVSYHRTLCPVAPGNRAELAGAISRLCDAWKSIHYPPETASVVLLVKVLAHLKQSDTRQQFAEKLSQFSCNYIEDSERLVHKLLGRSNPKWLVLWSPILLVRCR